MRLLHQLLVICVLTFTFPHLSFSWNAVGHMVIANIAYQELTPETRAKVNDLVSYMQMIYPQMDSFEKMAYWPDELRAQRIETFTRWHYIDIPFSQDNTPLKYITDTDNAVWAIKTIIPILKNNHANPYERARFLAFLTHIVGDLHQPLHTISRFSAKFPDGDRGGNTFFVYYHRKKIALHKLWDDGLGLYLGDQYSMRTDQIANTIMNIYPLNQNKNASDKLDPEEWLKEGMSHAKDVYNMTEETAPSEIYLAKGQQITQQESALAGHRLALLLNQILT